MTRFVQKIAPRGDCELCDGTGWADDSDAYGDPVPCKCVTLQWNQQAYPDGYEVEAAS